MPRLNYLASLWWIIASNGLSSRRFEDLQSRYDGTGWKRAH
jgi:hypothetical protein